MGRRNAGRCLVGVGVMVLLWGVLSFTGAAVGERPAELNLSERRPYTTVKRAVHAAFLPLVGHVAVGMLLVLAGAKIQGKEGDEA